MSPIGPPASAAFSPDGTKFAACYSSTLLLWDLSTGKQTAEFSFPPQLTSGTLKWLDDRYVLARHEILFDTTLRTAVWKYSHKGVKPVADSFDSNYWFVGKDPQNQIPGYYLGALKIPTQAVTASSASSNPEDLYILGPGGSATVSVSAGVPGVDQAEITQVLTKKLTANGVNVTGSAPVQVAFSCSQRATGESKTYRPLNGGGEEFTIQQQEVSMSLTITDSKGRKWERTSKSLLSGGNIETSDAVENLAKRGAGNVEGFAGGASIPRYVYPEAEGRKLPGSQITLRGEIDVQNN